MVAVRGDGYGGKGNKSDSFSVGPKIESSGNDLGVNPSIYRQAIACVCVAKHLCVLLALQRHVQHEDDTPNRGDDDTRSNKQRSKKKIASEGGERCAPLASRRERYVREMNDAGMTQLLEHH